MSGDRSVALVSCSEYPDGHVDDVLVVEPLAALGVTATFVTWDDAAVDWDAFDVVVLRSTWDYATRHEEFLTWAGGVANLRNPLAAVRWSSDKRYLCELARAGAPIVPTTFVEPDASHERVDAAIRAAAASASAGSFVVKPSIGAGSVDAGRFESADGPDIEQAIKHATALLDQGKAAMLQPYLDGIDHAGETALIFLNGEFSHAIRKEPLLAGGLIEVDGLFVEERTCPTDVTPAQLDAAHRVLDAAPFDRASLLYARVDLLPGADGRPLLLELELVEPSLFLGPREAMGSGAAERFAAAIAAVADRSGT